MNILLDCFLLPLHARYLSIWYWHYITNIATLVDCFLFPQQGNLSSFNWHYISNIQHWHWHYITDIATLIDGLIPPQQGCNKFERYSWHKKIKFTQCKNYLESENGLKIHIGRSHEYSDHSIFVCNMYGCISLTSTMLQHVLLLYKKIKFIQCKNYLESENGLKIH